ncbi:MAG: DUF4402 domain-containing protein [Melioribacteraceae bacterium]|nr:DUF4402 domain-containing protein [Melioribacteraceae bacterium]
MKLFKIYTILPAVLLCFSSVHAQYRSEASIPISLKLTKGLNLSTIKGDLDFGEIISNQSLNAVAKDPQNGVLLQIAGHPGREVIVEFDQTLLSNSSWVERNGGTLNQIHFSPSVETGNTENYNETAIVSAGQSVKLENGSGKKYLWVGGELQLNSGTPQGDYSGNFTLTINY